MNSTNPAKSDATSGVIPLLSRITAPLVRFLIILFTLGLSPMAHSQSAIPKPEDVFRLSAERASDGMVLLKWRIEPGFYLYREKISVRSADGAAIAIRTPPGEVKDDPTFGRTEIYWRAAEASFDPRGLNEQVTIAYQGCQDAGVCYPPVHKSLDLATLKIVDAGPLLDFGDAKAAQRGGVGVAAEVGPAIKIDETGRADGLLSSVLESRGPWIVLLTFLLLGVGLAFTPCVFPMYPILAGVLTRSGDQLSSSRALALSGAYVTAMASAFALLGIFAGWSGQNLQMALQAPFAIIIVALIFLALALSMFGLFELQLPSRWITLMGGTSIKQGGSLHSAAALGFTSALIVGPCVTAPLAGALLYIAHTGDTLLGAGALFALGLGKGIPLVAFGTVGATALPRAGAWMERVKQIFGFVFLGVTIWMLSRIIAPPHALALWALLFIAIGVQLGAFERASPESEGIRSVSRTLAITAMLYGVLLGIGAASGASDPLRPLAALREPSGTSQAQPSAFERVRSVADFKNALAKAPQDPALIYFTADWCVTCLVIKRSVLSDPAVQTRLKDLNLIKIDVSRNTPEQQELMRSLQVVGPPTMMFVSPSGKEHPRSRLVGDITSAALIASADKALER